MRSTPEPTPGWSCDSGRVHAAGAPPARGGAHGRRCTRVRGARVLGCDGAGRRGRARAPQGQPVPLHPHQGGPALPPLRGRARRRRRGPRARGRRGRRDAAAGPARGLRDADRRVQHRQPAAPHRLPPRTRPPRRRAPGPRPRLAAAARGLRLRADRRRAAPRRRGPERRSARAREHGARRDDLDAPLVPAVGPDHSGAARPAVRRVCPPGRPGHRGTGPQRPGGGRVTATSSGPLAGIRVVDLTRLLPGAFATAMLADLGADVIKVEQPGGGDPMRHYAPRIGDASAFTWVADRGKRSVVLNLRDPRGADAVLRLARTADVLVEGFRPGVADRLGVGYDAVRDVNPRLVYCSISGYGASGPLVREAGHDINYVGRAGLIGVTGIDGRPAVPGIQVGDLAGGSLFGIAGLLAALVRAERSGAGDHVDVSMTDGAFALGSLLLASHVATGAVPGIGTELLNGSVPCYGVYECADGRHLTVGALEAPFWAALCEGVGRPDLLPTQMDADALPVWRELFRSRPRDEWLDTLGGRDACVGPLNHLAEAAADPQLAARDMLVDVGGPALQLGTPLRFATATAGPRGPAPALGADTRALLAEAGFAEDEVAGMLADGAAAAPAASGEARAPAG